MKKLDVQNILIAVLIGLFVWQFFFTEEPPSEQKPIQIVIPPIEGTSGTKVIETVKVVPIEIPGQGEVYVDERWRDDYLNAKDSIERLQKYLQAIQVKEKEYTFIDNDTIAISGNLKTRGDLLEYKIDYTIKEKLFEYTPKVVKQRPRFAISIGADAGIPTDPTKSFLMRGNLGLENKRGQALSFGYDTEKRVYVGLKQSIDIVK